MPLDPRIERLVRVADRGDWGAQVALEAELMRSGRPARSNAARDAVLHESRSAGAYYAAMLLDALRQAQADGWWPAAGEPVPVPPVTETRALLVDPNDLSIERSDQQRRRRLPRRGRRRNAIDLILPDGLGHPRLIFHEKKSPGSYLDPGIGGWVHQEPTYPPECRARYGREACPGKVYGGIRLSVRAVYSKGVVRGTVKIESEIRGPYFLAQLSPSYTPRPLRAGWSDAKFLAHAEEDYCETYERVRRAVPGYHVLMRFEALRDRWGEAEGGDEAHQRRVRQEFYERVIKSARARELAPLPDPPPYRGLLTPAQAEGWHQLLGELEGVLAI